MKRICLIGMCMTVLLTTSVMPVYAEAGPGEPENPIPDEVTEEQWNKLNDQTIEFQELPGLIRYFNPSMQNTVDSMQNSIDNTQYTYNETISYIRDLRADIDELEDSDALNTSQGIDQYGILQGELISAKMTAGSIKKSLNLLDRSDSSINKSKDQVVKNYTYYADQVMIGYNSAAASRAMLEKMVELSSESLEARKIGRQVGTATEADVLSAQNDLLSARSSLINIENHIDSLRSSLCLMTGYSADATPQIEGLPQLDLENLSAMNLEEDTKKAIGNNYDLISERHATTNKVTTKTKIRNATVSEGEQNVTVSMQSFYQDIQQAKTAYQAACTSYEKASIQKRSADLSYQMGSISRLSYLQDQMAFLQAESGKQSAYNTLYQAYDTYQWAVKGIIMNSDE